MDPLRRQLQLLPKTELLARLTASRLQLAGIAMVLDKEPDDTKARELVHGILSGQVRVQTVPTLNPNEWSLQLLTAPKPPPVEPDGPELREAQG